jgi:hypothetical protein
MASEKSGSARRGERAGSREPVPQLLEEYLARGPETELGPILGRSGPVLARAGFLLHGVLAQGWSVGWLALFLAAELLLVLCLMRLGNRIVGRPLWSGEMPRGSAAAAAGWAGLALAATYLTGLRLEITSGGSWFGWGEGTLAGGGWISWGVLAYLALELVEFGREVHLARHGGRRFVSGSILQAAFFVIALCLAPILYFLLTYALAILSVESAPRTALALSLVAARVTAELGVLWYPRLAKSMGLEPRRFGSSTDPD